MGAVPQPLTAQTPVITGIPAYGTLIQVSTGGTPEVFTSIAGAGDLTGPGSQVGTVETTSHSTGAPIRTYVPGLIELGDFSFPCYWNPDDPTQNINSPYGLEYLFWSRKITKFQLVMPNASHRTRQFLAFVKQLSETYPVQGVCTRQIALHITSALTDVASPINLTPPNATSVPAAGQPTGTFQVATGGNVAPWLAIPSAPWITVTAPTAPQTGDGSVTYAVAANPNTGVTRTGSVDIAALQLSFSITQLGS